MRALLEAHLEFGRDVVPPEEAFALDVDGLLDPSITFVTARRSGLLVGTGALKELGPLHGELKSMHTAEAARRQGIGRAIVDHLVSIAASRNYERVSIETGKQDIFVPARAMYASAGFVHCPPFGPYVNSGTSYCMTIALEERR